LIRSNLRNQHCCTKSAHFGILLGPFNNIVEHVDTLMTHMKDGENVCVSLGRGEEGGV